MQSQRPARTQTRHAAPQPACRPAATARSEAWSAHGLLAGTDNWSFAIVAQPLLVLDLYVKTLLLIGSGSLKTR